MSLSRRHLLKAALLSPLLLSCRSSAQAPEPEKLPPLKGPLLKRAVPSSGELLPAVGLGTYQVFTSLEEAETRARLSKVLTEFHRHGGTFIDSSPMYGPAEASIGQLLPKVAKTSRGSWFLATKVWTDGKESGIRQMESSAEKMGVTQLDLMQIHNLRDWQAHLPTLKRYKEEGKIRYLGITTWGGNDHRQFETLMREEPLDFVQFTYNIQDREAEKRLLPMAGDRGIATVINRPFGQGALLRRLKDIPLPSWVVKDLHCQSWAQVLLKFILADDRVTVVIPATSKPHHMVDNMAAGLGPLPDAAQRNALAKLLEKGQ